MTMTYQDFADFWIDDAAYNVGRGSRYLSIAGELDDSVPPDRLQQMFRSSSAAHGVCIRLDGGEVQVAAAPWVFDLLDASKSMPPYLQDALVGALLGYNADKIQEWVSK